MFFYIAIVIQVCRKKETFSQKGKLSNGEKILRFGGNFLAERNFPQKVKLSPWRRNFRQNEKFSRRHQKVTPRIQFCLVYGWSLSGFWAQSQNFFENFAQGATFSAMESFSFRGKISNGGKVSRLRGKFLKGWKFLFRDKLEWLRL